MARDTGFPPSLWETWVGVPTCRPSPGCHRHLGRKAADGNALLLSNKGRNCLLKNKFTLVQKQRFSVQCFLLHARHELFEDPHVL